MRTRILLERTADSESYHVLHRVSAGLVVMIRVLVLLCLAAEPKSM